MTLGPKYWLQPPHLLSTAACCLKPLLPITGQLLFPLGAWSSFKTSPSPLLAKVGLKADMGRVCWRYTLLLFSWGGEAADHMAPAHRLVYAYQHTINWTRSLIQVLLHLLVQKFLLHLYLNTVFMFNIACNYYSSLFTQTNSFPEFFGINISYSVNSPSYLTSPLNNTIIHPSL